MRFSKSQLLTFEITSAPKHGNQTTTARGSATDAWSLKLGASLALGTWCLVLFSASCARARSYAIDWYKSAGGGGTSSSGQYTVSGTIGQLDVGEPVANGKYLTNAPSTNGQFYQLLTL